MESLPIPTPSHVSSSKRIINFLNHHFQKHQDLTKLPSLASHLSSECALLDGHLYHLFNHLSDAASNWASHSGNVRDLLHRLGHHRSLTSPPDGNGRTRDRTTILSVELPLLVNEVGRIETLRLYAETTLKLEALVGDLEDATFAIVNHTSRNNSLKRPVPSNPVDSGEQEEKLSHAIKTMDQIEDVLVSIMKSRPNWIHLLKAVDSRVEKALAILRPQVLSNHRLLLSFLGWPPSLSSSKTEKNDFLEIPNPLVLMRGSSKQKYSASFLELCALQHLHVRQSTRRHRLIEHQNHNLYKVSDTIDTGNQACFKAGLWPVDELVSPIASRMEYHFSRWSNEPEFIFVLVYKVTRDFLDGIENVLQPLIDKAGLVGCSAREAWVSAMVKMLSGYLERHIFPRLAKSYAGEDGEVEMTSWLHIVDLMISLDKKMQLLANSGTPLMMLFSGIEGVSRSESLLSVFHDHLDWLQIWADIELKDAQQKLNSQLADEKSWFINVKKHYGLNLDEEEPEVFLLCSREDYKAPVVADSVVKISWAMMERGWSLPSKSLRVQFIRSSGILFLNHFFILLLQRSQDVDFMTAVFEDEALLTVTGSVNVASYCESVLREWSEDVSFLDMTENEQPSTSSFFDDEITFLVKLETECLVEIVSALLRQFDALCLNYSCEQTEFGEQIMDDDKNISLSPDFIGALNMLQDRLRVLKLYLNAKDFTDLWRSVAEGLDHFIFSSVALSDVKFSRRAVDQFIADSRALVLIFKPFCARPDAFFPYINESLKLLELNLKEVDCLLKNQSEGKKRSLCLRERGFSHVSVDQAQKILLSRC